MIKTIWRLPSCAHGSCNTCPVSTHYSYLDGTDYWVFCACPCHHSEVLYPPDYKYDFTDQVIRPDTNWCFICKQAEVKGMMCDGCLQNSLDKIQTKVQRWADQKGLKKKKASVCDDPNYLENLNRDLVLAKLQRMATKGIK